jgi:hypothetical protein
MEIVDLFGGKIGYLQVLSELEKERNNQILKLINFQNLNTRDICDSNNGLSEVNILQNEPINEHINAYISKEEILKCIQKLKNEKACGEDEIINKYIKSTSNQFINIYEKLFNIIFDKGFVPHIWLKMLSIVE